MHLLVTPMREKRVALDVNKETESALDQRKRPSQLPAGYRAGEKLKCRSGALRHTARARSPATATGCNAGRHGSARVRVEWDRVHRQMHLCTILVVPNRI